MSITQYRTQSGSVYEVDSEQKLMRQAIRSEACSSKRVSAAWREYAELSFLGIGTCLVFTWGKGRDEHSATAEQIGEGADEDVTRVTRSTPVVGWSVTR